MVSAVEVKRPNLKPHAAPDGTVTIMFTDIERSTAMTERLGDQRAQEVLHIHNAIVREQIDPHQGFEAKSQGDGFMVAHSSARRALECAIRHKGASYRRSAFARKATSISFICASGYGAKRVNSRRFRCASSEGSNWGPNRS